VQHPERGDVLRSLRDSDRHRGVVAARDGFSERYECAKLDESQRGL
jgi:hypothetical protein